MIRALYTFKLQRRLELVQCLKEVSFLYQTKSTLGIECNILAF